MSSTVASNPCAEIIHHASDGILEQRWLPGQMTEGALKASLALLALEAERLTPSAILIDATQFQHRPGPGVMDGATIAVSRAMVPLVFRNSRFTSLPDFRAPSRKAARKPLMVRQSFRRHGFPAEPRHRVAQESIAALKQSAWRRYRAARSRCGVIQSPSVGPNNRPRPRAER